MKRIFISAAIVATLGLTAWKLNDNKERVAEKVYRPDPEQKVLVKTSEARIRRLVTDEQYLGTYIANREADVTAESQGKVLKVGVQAGQYVQAGQVIAQLDNEQLRYQLEALQISLEGYQNDARRYETLVKGDATPAINLEKTELSIRATEAQIKQLNKQLANTTIKAPFSGLVTRRMFEIGTIIAPGMPLVHLADMSVLKLQISVPEADINSFRAGQTIPVASETIRNNHLSGQVTLVGSQGDASHNYPVEISVKAPAGGLLRAGMYGAVQKANSHGTGLLSIERQSLIGSSKQPQVYAIEQGKAVLKNVELGKSDERFTEIRSGLKPGDQVVVSGQINLQNGTPVSIN